VKKKRLLPSSIFVIVIFFLPFFTMNFRITIDPLTFISVVVITSQGLRGRHPARQGVWYYQARMGRTHQHLWAGWGTPAEVSRTVMKMRSYPEGTMATFLKTMRFADPKIIPITLAYTSKPSEFPGGLEDLDEYMRNEGRILSIMNYHAFACLVNVATTAARGQLMDADTIVVTEK
jgi:hypothetical protein